MAMEPILTPESKFPLGQRIALPGHFLEPVTLEAMRFIGSGYECRVRLGDPEHFFRVSYLTKGLRSLLEDVLLRLTGGTGNRVLKLLTPFGGGKSHTLASLFHAAGNRKALDVLP